MHGKTNRSYRKLKVVIILLLFIAIGVGGIIIVKKRKEQLAKIPPPTLPPLPVNVASVKKGELNKTRLYTGIIQAMTTGLISPRITGTILNIKPLEGDRVKKGQVLVLLDSRTQRAKIGALKAQLEAARSSLDTMRSIYQRDLELFNGKALSREALDKSRTSYETARAKVTEIENNLKSARVELSYTRITAPYGGLVLTRLMEPGDTALPGKPILELEAIHGKYKIIVKVPQVIFPALTRNTRVEVIPPSGVTESSMDLTITKLYPAPSSQGAAMPTCEIVLKNRPFGLPPGSTVKVLFHLKKATGLVIPARALLEQAIGNPLVYAVTGENRIHVIPVRLILRDEDILCVDGKLEPGTKVVVAGEDVLIRLHEGDEVYPVERQLGRRL